MAHSVLWDAAYEAIPADTDLANTLGDVIRDLKRDIRERMEVDHDWDDVDHAGKHNKVTLQELGADPTLAANEGALYSKDVAGVTELFYKDSAGAVLQLTEGGKLKADSIADISSNIVLDNAVKLQGKDTGGTAEDLIQMTAADVIEVGDPGHESTLHVATAAGLNLKVAGGASKKIWHEENDGAGSTLDADLLDGAQRAAFMEKAADFVMTVNDIASVDDGSASHGPLAATPSVVIWYIEKTGGAAENGWVVGDRVWGPSIGTNTIVVGADAANIYWARQVSVDLNSRTGGSNFNITLANWKLVAKAWL